MATNKVVLRTTQEFMADYRPVYSPLYPLLLGNSQSYSEDVGSVDFKRVTAIGDIRNRHVTPKDTELKQINAGPESKTFKKYFLASQYTQSNLQDLQGNEDVIKQVLEENQKYMDEIVLFGEGTSSLTDVVNNGLFWSNDPNYDLESNTVVDSTDPLTDLHTAVLANVQIADQVSGKKVIIFYGDFIVPLFDSLYAANPVPFKKVLGEVLGSEYSLMKMPAGISTQSSSGWLIVNLDATKLHYTALPKLAAQGINEEKMYSWHNFMMGSAMVEVKAPNAVIHQPASAS